MESIDALVNILFISAVDTKMETIFLKINWKIILKIKL
jgi:hypothetical protein